MGVDLAPIKPIPKTITFQSDITSDKCRATIRGHLKTWKADTVLHDGAPNVGTAWVQDAFSQAELALQAMKLATEFLIEGGTFVTKVFRSKDYNSLLWVFKQLFDKVDATKPPSSRNVSAEIFVVCRGYKAPRRVDPKFLDSRSVFAELPDPVPNNEAKVFNPEVKKRKRDGYEEGKYIQFEEVPASQFIETTDPIALLGSVNRLSFAPHNQEDIALATLERLPETTLEVRQCCDDLKVLGRKEFRLLLRWRLKARATFGYATKKPNDAEADTEEVAEVVPIDEEEQIRGDLQRISEKETAQRKRERRRENERKQREVVRMQMHMMPPTEIGLEQSGLNGEDAMFSIRAVNRADVVGEVSKGRMVVSTPQKDEQVAEHEIKSDEEGDQLDEALDSLYEEYQLKKSTATARSQAKKARKEHDDGEWSGISDNESDSSKITYESDDSENSAADAKADSTLPFRPHLQDSESRKTSLSRRAANFFEQDIFKDIGGLDSDAERPPDAAIESEPSKTDLATATPSSMFKANTTTAGLSPVPMEPTGSSSSSQEPNTSDEDDMTHASDGDTDGFETVEDQHQTDWEKQGETRPDGRLDIDIITAEAMTLAQQIATGHKSTHDLLDDGFNKYTFRDRDGLPEWFLDDEHRHSQPQRPVTAAAAAAIKEKLRVLNARPIKKVREAKDRKKFKAAQRLEKLKKKSALLADEEGMTEKEKAQGIARLMSRAAKKKPKQQVKLVVARGGNRGISGRPRGVKGKYKIVDARLKKDVRAEKRTAKKHR